MGPAQANLKQKSVVAACADALVWRTGVARGDDDVEVVGNCAIPYHEEALHD